MKKTFAILALVSASISLAPAARADTMASGIAGGIIYGGILNPNAAICGMMGKTCDGGDSQQQQAREQDDRPVERRGYHESDRSPSWQQESYSGGGGG